MHWVTGCCIMHLCICCVDRVMSHAVVHKQLWAALCHKLCSNFEAEVVDIDTKVLLVPWPMCHTTYRSTYVCDRGVCPQAFKRFTGVHSQSLAARCSACSAAQLYQPASCAADIHDCLIFTVFIAICEPDYAYHAVAQCCAQRHSSCVVHSLQSSFAHQVSNHSNDVLDNMYS